MDRPRRRSGGLILFVSGGLLAAGLAAAPTLPPLHALDWLAPGADGARLMTQAPPECLSAPRDSEAAWRVEVGRAAFRSPFTLGGVAARAGVDCETCHRNGRTNPDFDFPGISNAPGTADVRSFLFSPRRGDHRHAAKSIPDLGGPKSGLKVSQDPGSGELEHFIHGLVTEEFDGAEPAPPVLAGLAAYVRALSPSACPPGPVRRLRAAEDIDATRRAVRAAIGALDRHDPATADAMVMAARAELGALAERYAALAADRAALVEASSALASIDGTIRAGEPVARGLGAWLAASPAWARRLIADEPRSYYDRATLARAIARQTPGTTASRVPLR